MSKAIKYLTISHHYNNNKIEESIGLLMRDRRVRDLGRGKFGVHLNEGDSDVAFTVTKNTIKFVSEQVLSFPNGNNPLILKFPKGCVLQPWDIYVSVKHKGNEKAALLFYSNAVLKDAPPYIRVVTDYFKVVTFPDKDGIDRIELKKWTKDTLKDDYGKDILSIIPGYDGFGMFPNNIEYQTNVGSRYNLYNKFSHKPAKSWSEEKIKWSMHLIKHIWGDQWELGLVYMQCLYLYPKQILPILGLVSEERETGKSTLGDWIGIIFGNNSCVITPKDISSSFNSSYAEKNIIIIEETKIQDSADLEKIKTIATQKKLTVNPKFVSPFQMDFYAKIIMFSNHEDKFVRIDEVENRYWVLKIPSLKGKANHNILNDLTAEIPAFLAFLQSLPTPDFSKSRMVFTQEEINTNILEKTKENSRSSVHKVILERLDLYGEDNPEVEFLEFRYDDIYERFFERNSNVDLTYVKSVIQNEMKLRMDSSTRNELLWETGSRKRTKVRCYKIPNPHYNIEKQEEEEEDVPF